MEFKRRMTNEEFFKLLENKGVEVGFYQKTENGGGVKTGTEYLCKKEYRKARVPDHVVVRYNGGKWVHPCLYFEAKPDMDLSLIMLKTKSMSEGATAKEKVVV